MKTALVATSFALVLASISTPAVAQSRFCIGGDLDHLTATDRAACTATLQAARSAAATMHAPDGWHFVVVCGEEGWKDYASFSSRGEAALVNASADTNLDEHTTYFREARMHNGGARGLQGVVAHEIASIVLKTDDEGAIQTQVATWERKGFTQVASLR